MKKSQKGFTLLELLVVISIIALLSSITIASLSEAKKKARDVARAAAMIQVKTALVTYAVDHDGAFPDPHEFTNATLVNGRYCIGAGDGNYCWGSWEEDDIVGITDLDKELKPYFHSTISDWYKPYYRSGGTTRRIPPANTGGYVYQSWVGSHFLVWQIETIYEIPYGEEIISPICAGGSLFNARDFRLTISGPGDYQMYCALPLDSED